MSGSRRNTLVFWQHKTDGNNFGGGTYLSSIKEADQFEVANNRTDPYCRFKSVTLTDEEVAQVADEKSQINNETLLKKFNPFSPEGIAYKKEKELFKAQKTTFSLGLFLEDSKKQNGQKNKSPLKSALAQNSLFDANAIKEIFSFLAPDIVEQKILSKTLANKT